MSARRGMSLVEVLIAAVLLALGLGPVGYLMFTAMAETDMDRMELEATTLANETLEQVRSMAEGRIRVPGMLVIPVCNPFPLYPEWVDVEKALKEYGPAFPLYRGCGSLEELSRMYIEPTRRGFHRYLQVIRPNLLLGEQIAYSPFLLEIRVRVDYGPSSEDPLRSRKIFLDTLMNHEDVQIPK